ncbi:MAG: Mrp/NBP35 family ATP-binding protein [Clostridia bacterium]|nr:Mrp/NBP35 family ATP-binding protein [Clostridia bacterium]
MSNECDHNCEGCSATCDEREDKITFEKPHELTRVKKVIGIVSGKGGVGKSLVTSLLAIALQKKGKKCAILDADITGPSIPKIFGIKGMADNDGVNIFPRESMLGVKVISTNLLLENTTDPVIWRGPLIAGMVKQFWTDVIWGDIDYMFVDMPPGTGDVPLTVFQSIKIDGIIVVTSPQELVSMIVEKAVKMAKMMKIPVLGVVENMSYIKCENCGEEISVFGKSKVNEVATDFELMVLGRMPIEHKVAEACDAGNLETLEVNYLDEAIRVILALK